MNSIFHRNCVLKDTSANIANSCIGRNVKIGSNVTIQNSIIFNNVTIGDDVKIVNSLICCRTTIGNGQSIKDQKISHGATLQDVETKTNYQRRVS
jgi:translation initiation factor eIF-2B subunit epsilon